MITIRSLEYSLSVPFVLETIFFLKTHGLEEGRSINGPEPFVLWTIRFQDKSEFYFLCVYSDRGANSQAFALQIDSQNQRRAVKTRLSRKCTSIFPESVV